MHEPVAKLIAEHHPSQMNPKTFPILSQPMHSPEFPTVMPNVWAQGIVLGNLNTQWAEKMREQYKQNCNEDNQRKT